MWDALDRQLIARLSDDLGDDRYPYQRLAQELGESEQDILARIRRYQQMGVLRRLGAILRHQRAGYTANGMSVWNVPDERVTEVAALFSACPMVSHCYERPRLPDWPYNLYAMIHTHTREACQNLVETLAQDSGLCEYQILFSLREFKKTSRQY